MLHSVGQTHPLWAVLGARALGEKYREKDVLATTATRGKKV